MLTNDQIPEFDTQGYVVETDLITEGALGSIRMEYAQLTNTIYAGFYAKGLINAQEEQLDLWGQLQHVFADCNYSQSLDISLPGNQDLKGIPFCVLVAYCLRQ